MAALRESIAHASELVQQGRLPEARTALGDLLARAPDHAEALHLAGMVELMSGWPAAAVPLLRRCVEIAPAVSFAWSNLGVACNACGDFTNALAAFQKALELDPRSAATMKNMGIALRGLKRHDEAMASFRRAAQREPNDFELHREVGDLLVDMGRPAEALARYDRALAMNASDPATHHNRGAAAWRAGDLERAERDVRRALELAPQFARAHATLGVVLLARGQPEAAATSHRNAIELVPGVAEFHNNLGVALEAMGRRAEAIEAYGKGLGAEPAHVETLENRAAALAELRRYGEALADYERVQSLAPGRPYNAGHRLQAKLALCDWPGFEPLVASIAEGLVAGRRESQPFPLCYVGVPAPARLRCAQMYADDILGDAPATPWRRPPYFHKRVRVGYFSADFRDHPVGQLMVPIAETHDRSRVKTFAFSFGPAGMDATRARLEGAFEQFEDVARLPAAAIAELARSLEIDVAVDLMGHTSGARTGIFAQRVAPVQAQFLGYPGTTGAACFDYLVADRVIVPEEHFAFYSEKAAWVRGTALAAARLPADRPVPARPALGLPGEGFVFCCFCQRAKITPDAFDAWMRIVGRVPGSVLWLADPGEAAARNLRAEAERRGVDAARLVFAPRLPAMADHLARLAAADLFLDTFHYGGHVTASDALQAGVPVLTRAGDSFAARVSASLLHSLGFEGLVASSTQDYEELAVALAGDGERLGALRRQLERNRKTAAAFDPAALARDLEELYRRMVARHQSGLEPEPLAL